MFEGTLRRAPHHIGVGLRTDSEERKGKKEVVFCWLLCACVCVYVCVCVCVFLLRVSLLDEKLKAANIFLSCMPPSCWPAKLVS